MEAKKILQAYQCGQNPLPELRKETGLPVHFEYETPTNVNWAVSAGPEKLAEKLGYNVPPVCVFVLTDSEKKPVKVTILHPVISSYEYREASDVEFYVEDQDEPVKEVFNTTFADEAMQEIAKDYPGVYPSTIKLP